MQCYMEFSRSALVHNAESIIKYVGCPVIGMVKLNGYGLSVTEAARIWLDAGATMLGVSRPDEALSLRRDGIEADILLTAPVADTAALNSLLMERIILTVTSWENAVFYAKNCALSRFPVHIAVDTGMGRFGLRWDDIEGIKAVYSMERLMVEGVFSHFSTAFGADFSSVQTQLERFTQITDRLSADGYSVGMRHIANTAAALRFPQTRLDAVRIGGGLLGISGGECPLELTRTGVLKAQVVDIKQFSAGDTVGYASICRIRKPTRAVIVAAGYADGLGYMRYPDHFSLRYLAGDALRILQTRSRPITARFAGHDLPLIGRVGNQYTMFDAEDIRIGAGDYVELDADVLFPNRSRIID